MNPVQNPGRIGTELFHKMSLSQLFLIFFVGLFYIKNRRLGELKNKKLKISCLFNYNMLYYYIDKPLEDKMLRILFIICISYFIYHVLIWQLELQSGFLSFSLFVCGFICGASLSVIHKKVKYDSRNRVFTIPYSFTNTHENNDKFRIVE